MEKLIELLNEYDEYRGEKRRDYGWTKDKVELDVKMIIFKKFGFIKWLVENDKIDLDMVREKLGIPCCVWYGSGRIIAVKDVEDYRQILMLLSISDTPIEDLLLYLK